MIKGVEKQPKGWIIIKTRMGGNNLIPRKVIFILILFVLGLGGLGCSSTPSVAPSPESLLETARLDIRKHRHEQALKTLERLKPVTADTRLGGEVQFLLGEARFLRGKYAEAEVEYGTYLDLFPDGPFSEDALYKSALSKIKQIKKIGIGFFYFRSYIPSDRNISTLRETRVLLERYLLDYPSGKWSSQASQMSRELLVKEGEHELGIMEFYLKKKQPEAVLARAERVFTRDFPERIKSQARELAEKAQDLQGEKGSTVTE